MFDMSKNGEKLRVHLQTAARCAATINRAFGVETMTAYQLSEAIQDGNAGMSPFQAEKPSEISDDDLA